MDQIILGNFYFHNTNLVLRISTWIALNLICDIKEETEDDNDDVDIDKLCHDDLEV